MSASDRQVTAEVAYWRDPEVDPPPTGNILLLTRGGVLVSGRWRDDGGFVAWAPKPKVPEAIKRKLLPKKEIKDAG